MTNDDQRRGMAKDSMVSGGCVVSGASLDRFVLFSDVEVHSCSIVCDSVLLPDVDIGRHCEIQRAIIDRGTRICARTRVRVDHDEDRARGLRVTGSGLVLVTPDMLGQPIHQVR